MSAGNVPAAINDGICGPESRSAERNRQGKRTQWRAVADLLDGTANYWSMHLIQTMDTQSVTFS
jgi:hypothetical protein